MSTPAPQDVHEQFVLSGFNPQFTLVVMSLAFVAGFVGVILPLLSALNLETRTSDRQDR